MMNIQTLISKNRIEEALTLLNETAKQTSYRNNALLVLSRYNTLKSEQYKGIMTNEQIRIERARILSSALNIAEQIGMLNSSPDQPISSQYDSQPKPDMKNEISQITDKIMFNSDPEYKKLRGRGLALIGEIVQYENKRNSNPDYDFRQTEWEGIYRRYEQFIQDAKRPIEVLEKVKTQGIKQAMETLISDISRENLEKVIQLLVNYDPGYRFLKNQLKEVEDIESICYEVHQIVKEL